MSRRADAVSFGLDFQVNAAIILMIENMKEMEYIRLESDEEDISIKLNSGKYILAQAKSHIHGSYDFQNVRKDLKKSLTTLSEGANKVVPEKLILVTNSANPLKDDSKTAFIGGGKRDFSDLPPSSQELITNYLAEVSNPLDPSLLRVQVIPFETDEYDERYKMILSAIKDFIGPIRSSNYELPVKLMDIWRRDLFVNGSKHDSSLVLSKKDVLWPILVIITDISNMDDDLQDKLDMDEGEYEEIVHRYRDFINSKCEKYSSFTKVLYDFNNFTPDKAIPRSKKIHAFLEECWGIYKDDFRLPSLEPELQEYLVKIILYSILRRRVEVDRVKRAVNL